MWSMPLSFGDGNAAGVIRREGFGDATARPTAAPAAVAADPSRSWRRVSGDIASALLRGRGDGSRARAEDVRAERRHAVAGGVAQMAVPVRASAVDAEQVLERPEQRVVVVGVGVVHRAAGHAPADDERARAAAPDARDAGHRGVRTGLLTAARCRVLL